MYEKSKNWGGVCRIGWVMVARREPDGNEASKADRGGVGLEGRREFWVREEELVIELCVLELWQDVPAHFALAPELTA